MDDADEIEADEAAEVEEAAVMDAEAIIEKVPKVEDEVVLEGTTDVVTAT